VSRDALRGCRGFALGILFILACGVVCGIALALVAALFAR
jgi:hypothetical protein